MLNFLQSESLPRIGSVLTFVLTQNQKSLTNDKISFLSILSVLLSDRDIMLWDQKTIKFTGKILKVFRR